LLRVERHGLILAIDRANIASNGGLSYSGLPSRNRYFAKPRLRGVATPDISRYANFSKGGTVLQLEPLSDKASRLVRATFAQLRPPPEIPLAEWIEEHVQLPEGLSKTPWPVKAD